jgi:hypothetical protein
MGEKIFKIEAYVPKIALKRVMNALYEKGFGKIGNYDCCLSWYRINASWRPTAQAKPFLGKTGKIEKTVEYKIEFRCIEDELDAAVKTIKDNHPYEEVCVNITEIKTKSFGKE